MVEVIANPIVLREPGWEINVCVCAVGYGSWLLWLLCVGVTACSLQWVGWLQVGAGVVSWWLLLVVGGLMGCEMLFIEPKRIVVIVVVAWGFVADHVSRVIVKQVFVVGALVNLLVLLPDLY